LGEGSAKEDYVSLPIVRRLRIKRTSKNRKGRGGTHPQQREIHSCDREREGEISPRARATMSLTKQLQSIG